jgi:tight adherence protein C
VDHHADRQYQGLISGFPFSMREAPNLPKSPDPAPNSAPGSRRTGRAVDRILPPEQRAGASQGFGARVIRPYLDRLTDPAGALMRNVDLDAVRVRLMRAGFPYGMRAQTFVLSKFVGIIIGAFLFSVVFPFFNVILAEWGLTMPLYLFPFWMALGGFYGFRLPDIWLGFRIRHRQQEITLVLPDMIDLIAISVEAGLGLIMAVQRISERFDNPLSEEFLRMIQEVRLGRSQADALRDMATRIDVPDLTTLLTSIVQAETLGLAVSNVLKIQAERLREKRAQRAREQAQKAPIKMTFPLVLFIFPALFVVILGPALIKIFLGPSF